MDLVSLLPSSVTSYWPKGITAGVMETIGRLPPT